MTLDPTDPAAVFAAYGLARLGLAAGLDIPDSGIMPEITVAVPPDTEFGGTQRHPGHIDVTAGAATVRLDWWTRAVWHTAPHPAGGGYCWPPLNARAAWKPWAGRLGIGSGLPELAALAADAAAGRPIADALAYRAGGYHDWSGLDPQRSWTALDIGFSPDIQGMKVVGRPVMTLLACIGLQAVPVIRTAEDVLYPVWWPETADPLAMLAVWPQAIGSADFGYAEPAVYAALLARRSKYLYSARHGAPAAFVAMTGNHVTHLPAGQDLGPDPDAALPPSRRRQRIARTMT